MVEWTEIFDTSMIFGLDNCRQLFKAYLKNGELLFLKDNKEKVIFDGYSGMNVQIQLSGVIIGLLNGFFDFLAQNTYEEIINKLKDISDFQKDNLILFLKYIRSLLKK